jgi:hypothetical protein
MNQLAPLRSTAPQLSALVTATDALEKGAEIAHRANARMTRYRVERIGI